MSEKKKVEKKEKRAPHPFGPDWRDWPGTASFPGRDCVLRATTGNAEVRAALKARGDSRLVRALGKVEKAGSGGVLLSALVKGDPTKLERFYLRSLLNHKLIAAEEVPAEKPAKASAARVKSPKKVAQMRAKAA
jgi:hypothetical protein